MKQGARTALAAPAAMPSPVLAEPWHVDGAWGVRGNWSPTGVPNGVDASATLAVAMAAPGAITRDAPVTVGPITGPETQEARSRRLDGPDPLTFDVSSGNAGASMNSRGDLIGASLRCGPVDFQAGTSGGTTTSLSFDIVPAGTVPITQAHGLRREAGTIRRTST